MKIFKICLIFFALAVSIINGIELKYTDVAIRIYNNSPRFPSFNSDALKPLNFSLEGLDFISFDSDMLKILNFNYEPYVPIKAWLTIESDTNALNLYIEENKGSICYIFSKEDCELLIKDIDKHTEWSKQATQKKILADKELSQYKINVKFRSHDTWHIADQLTNASGNIIPLMTSRLQSFEKEKHMFVLKPKSLKHENLAIYSPTDLFFYPEEIKKFKVLLDERKISAIIRINKDNSTAENELK